MIFGGGGYGFFWKKKVCFQFLEKKKFVFDSEKKKMFVSPSAATICNAKIDRKKLFTTCREKNRLFLAAGAKKSLYRKKNHSPPQKIKWLLPK